MNWLLPVLSAASRFRSAGIETLVYPKAAKVKNSSQFAQKSEIPYVAVIGVEESRAGTVQFRDMEAGSQEELSIEAVIEKVHAGKVPHELTDFLCQWGLAGHSRSNSPAFRF